MDKKAMMKLLDHGTNGNNILQILDALTIGMGNHSISEVDELNLDEDESDTYNLDEDESDTFNLDEDESDTFNLVEV